MSQIKAYIGAAGSGKTFALMNEVEQIASAKALLPGQCVLAITFMHGSRRRLAARLHDFAKKGLATQCETIDSFCLQLVNRFRRYLGRDKPIMISPRLSAEEWQESSRGWKTTFTAIRLSAIELLKSSAVRSTVAAAYPIIVVDEFQDCEGDLLEIVGLLSAHSMVMLAADEFQHLSSEIKCPARNWLNSAVADIIELDANHRTSEDILRETALALREGRAATRAIEVHLVASGMAAWHISSRLSWGKIAAEKSKVLICPVRPGSSKWLQGILGSLAKELGKKSKVGPNPFRWEGGDDEMFLGAMKLVEESCATDNAIGIPVLVHLEKSDNHTLQAAVRQARRLVGLRGDAEILKNDFTDILEQTSHSAKAFRRERHNARVAMTVHGAKNREFDYVFIAWPYEVTGDAVLARKLLYNAVTRAREGAVLFVQGDKKRVKKDAALAILECGIVDNNGASRKRPKKTS